MFASRALEVRCRRRDIEVWRSGALEACCRCRDVEEFASRALAMRCRRVDVEMTKGMELGSSGDALQACRRGDVERYGARELERIVGISSFRSSRFFGQNACGLRRLYSSSA